MMWSSAANVAARSGRTTSRPRTGPCPGSRSHAFQAQRRSPPARKRRRTARRSGERQVDRAVRVVRHPAAPSGDLGAQHRADGAVDVAGSNTAPGRVHHSIAGADLDHGCPGPMQAVVLGDQVPARSPMSGHVRDRREVQPRGLRWSNRFAGIDHFGVSDGLVEGAEPQFGQFGSRTSSAMYSKNVGDELGACPAERTAQFRVLGRYPTGQVSRWQTRIMMQPITTSGRSRSRTPRRPEGPRSRRPGRS